MIRVRHETSIFQVYGTQERTYSYGLILKWFSQSKPSLQSIHPHVGCILYPLFAIGNTENTCLYLYAYDHPMFDFVSSLSIMETV